MTGTAVAADAVKSAGKRSFLSDVVKRFGRHRLAMISLVFLIVEILLVLILPEIMRLDPYSIDAAAGAESAPSAAHILGTDSLGRDVFSRVVYGGRTSLYVGLVSTLISVLIGLPLGLFAGYFGGWLEMVVMRLSEVFMSVPSFILVLVLVSFIGPSISSVTLVIGIMGWPRFAKLLHGSILSVREKDYVEAARARGAKDSTIMLKFILPNSFSPLLVAFTFGIASAILQESSLSFLGMGVQPPAASWGNILYGAQSITILSRKLWMWLPAGAILMLTIFSTNFFGDGLRDALDPKIKI